jgi:hypothetical protein
MSSRKPSAEVRLNGALAHLQVGFCDHKGSLYCVECSLVEGRHATYGVHADSALATTPCDVCGLSLCEGARHV